MYRPPTRQTRDARRPAPAQPAHGIVTFRAGHGHCVNGVACGTAGRGARHRCERGRRCVCRERVAPPREWPSNGSFIVISSVGDATASRCPSARRPAPSSASHRRGALARWRLCATEWASLRSHARGIGCACDGWDGSPAHVCAASRSRRLGSRPDRWRPLRPQRPRLPFGFPSRRSRADSRRRGRRCFGSRPMGTR